MTRSSPLIVNLFGGPGSGKSTTAAGVFYNLKMLHINVELVLEFAKELTWEERLVALDNQPYVLGEQLHRIHRLIGQVDAIITDCPIPMGVVYLKSNATDYKESFTKFNVDLFNTMDNMNYFLLRGNDYQEEGRQQNAEEANQKDDMIQRMLTHNDIPYKKVVSNGTSVQNILIDVVNRLRN